MSDVPRRGITLLGLRELVRRVLDAGGLRTTARLTTEMFSNIAKARLTLARRCACVDLLGDDEALAREPPTVFVSHTWGSPFDALLDVVAQTDRTLRERSPDSTPSFWLDFAVNNQYGIDKGFEWLKTVFRSNVQSIGHTVLAYPYGAERRVLPVDRIWCVWEMYCSVVPPASASSPSSPQTRADFELCIPSGARERFEVDLVHSLDHILDELTKIDLTTATAFKASDKDSILAVIGAEEGGVDRVTREVVKAIKRWMLKAGLAARLRIAAGDSRSASVLQLNLARLMRGFGYLGIADTTVRDGEMLAREATEARARVHGADAPETLEAKLLVALLVKDQGGLRECEKLMREVLEGRSGAFGPNHPETLDAVYHLGRHLQDEESFAEAEKLLREGYERQKEFFAFSHGHRVVVGAYGQLLSLLGRHAEAEPLLRESLKITVDAEGARNYAEARSYGAHLMARNLADVLLSRAAEAVSEEAGVERRARLEDEAAALLDHALACLLRSFGELNASTLIAVRVRGRLRRARGDATGAEADFRAALAGLKHQGNVQEQRRTFGELIALLRARGDTAGTAAAEGEARALQY